ncbi:MAG: Bax inhibitor-1/YccA family protein [Deltaproteobacteria bacterium]|nr:Bax inhibitor-1/YccA family protein [Deltaproteobacteria bacterium]
MYPYENRYPQAAPAGLIASSADTVAFLRKVYTLFTLSVVAATGGAVAALYAGAETSKMTMVLSNGSSVVVPPLIAFFANHWIIGGLLFLGSVYGTSAVRLKPGINVAALLGMGFISGLVIAPAIWMTQMAATSGTTLTQSPVRDAFLLASAAFLGLTTYALVSRKDFSFLRGFLTMGIWVVLGAILLNIFIGSSAFGLALASAGVLLFGGFILFDTSRMLRRPEERGDAVGAAISLYLSVLNLFLFLLTIFRGGSRNG